MWGSLVGCPRRWFARGCCHVCFGVFACASALVRGCVRMRNGVCRRRPKLLLKSTATRRGRMVDRFCDTIGIAAPPEPARTRLQYGAHLIIVSFAVQHIPVDQIPCGFVRCSMQLVLRTVAAAACCVRLRGAERSVAREGAGLYVPEMSANVVCIVSELQRHDLMGHQLWPAVNFPAQGGSRCRTWHSNGYHEEQWPTCAPCCLSLPQPR